MSQHSLGLALAQPRQGRFSILDKYIENERLGGGAYSTVFKGTCRATRRPVAIKIMREDPEEGTTMIVMREISLLKELRHPNIIGFVECQTVEGGTALVLEYCPGDLEWYMAKRRADGAPLGRDPGRVQRLLAQLLRGVAFCHERGVLHRDLKPQNLLIDGNGVLKIADFGLAKQTGFISEAERLIANVVTLWYRAPELLQPFTTSPPYGAAIDVWSCGCIFAEMLTDNPLFRRARDEQGQLQGIILMRDAGVAGFIEKWQRFARSQWHPEALDVLQQMLQFQPASRITAPAALAHPYFRAQFAAPAPSSTPAARNVVSSADSQATPRPRNQPQNTPEVALHARNRQGARVQPQARVMGGRRPPT